MKTDGPGWGMRAANQDIGLRVEELPVRAGRIAIDGLFYKNYTMR
jgi:hypothetical protein